MRILFSVILVLLCSHWTIAQSIDDLRIPNKQVIQNSKSTVENTLTQLKDTLDLSKKEIRIRNFELTPCNDWNALSLKYGKFVTVFVGRNNSCYFFQHRTNYKGSYHTIDFLLDQDGKLINYDVNWFLVTH